MAATRRELVRPRGTYVFQPTFYPATRYEPDEEASRTEIQSPYIVIHVPPSPSPVPGHQESTRFHGNNEDTRGERINTTSRDFLNIQRCRFGKSNYNQRLDLYSI